MSFLREGQAYLLFNVPVLTELNRFEPEMVVVRWPQAMGLAMSCWLVTACIWARSPVALQDIAHMRGTGTKMRIWGLSLLLDTLEELEPYTLEYSGK
ncbi:hypothetical protein WJX79_008826 [Trebouxia sp. C0005]